MKINGIKLLTISNCCLQKYRDVTRKGKNYSDLDIAKRLTRHYILGTLIHEENNNIATFNFGNMDIVVDLIDMVVITCRNYRGDSLINVSKVDNEEKREWGRILEIKIDNIWDLVSNTYGVQV